MEPRLHFAIRLQDVGCLGTETASHSTLLLRWALRIPVCVCVYITLQITAFAHHFLRAKTPLGGEVISPFVVMTLEMRKGGGCKGYAQDAFGLSGYTFTDMRRLTKGLRSEKRVVRRFLRCADVMERTYRVTWNTNALQTDCCVSRTFSMVSESALLSDALWFPKEHCFL